jgi:hypothetical protein
MGNQPPGWAPIRNYVSGLLTIEYRVYIPQEKAFPARSKKTKKQSWRYPRKISLLKDLARRISHSSLLGKYMKTGSHLGEPSKISLLKDLARALEGTKGSFREVL